MGALTYVLLPVVLALVVNVVIYAWDMNEPSKKKEDIDHVTKKGSVESKLLPPGIVIGSIWVVLLGFLGYAFYVTTLDNMDMAPAVNNSRNTNAAPILNTATGNARSTNAPTGNARGFNAPTYNARSVNAPNAPTVNARSFNAPNVPTYNARSFNAPNAPTYNMNGRPNSGMLTMPNLVQVRPGGQQGGAGSGTGKGVASLSIALLVLLCLSYPFYTRGFVASYARIANATVFVSAFLLAIVIAVTDFKAFLFVIPLLLWLSYVVVVDAIACNQMQSRALKGSVSEEENVA